jgi:hypothetical protein
LTFAARGSSALTSNVVVAKKQEGASDLLLEIGWLQAVALDKMLVSFAPQTTIRFAESSEALSGGCCEC